MAKLFIVEDNWLILDGIVHKVNSFSLDIEIVGAVTDSEKAVEQIAQLKPDIIITDISMPQMNGLQLIKHTSQYYEKPPKYIIISGYNDFKYAQEAMRLGVSDYLLKPIDNHELRAILEKLISALTENHNTQKLELFRQALAGAATDFNSQNSVYILGELVIGCDDCSYLVSVPEEIHDTVHLLSSAMENAFHNLTAISSYRHYNHITLIFEEGSVNYKEVECFIHSRLTETNPEVFFTLFFSIKPIALSDFYKTNLYCERMIHQYQIFGKNSMFFQAPEPAVIESCLSASVLAHLLNQKKISQFKNELRKAARQWDSDNYTTLMLLHEMDEIERSMGSSIWGPSLHASDFHLPLQLICSQSYADLGEKLCAFSDQLYMAVCAIDLYSQENIAGKVATYLQKHYQEAISIKDLSRDLGISSEYLSKVFKAKYQISPMGYLTQYRLERAKYIIQENPYLSLKYIAAESGYPDNLYFSKKFKSAFGIAPVDYKNQIIKKIKETHHEQL